MYFRDIQLVPYTSDAALRGRLMSSWRHIEDILRFHLPQKLDINGQGKLVLSLSTPELAERSLYSEVLGIATLRVDGFDANRYLALPYDKQHLAALELLRSGLIGFCERCGVAPEPLTSACDKVAACGFEFQFAYRKLCKFHPTRRLKAEVLVTYKRGATDVALRLSGKSKTILHNQHVASCDLWWPTVWFDYFKSRWDGEKFIVSSRTDKSTFEFDAGYLLAP